MAEIDKAMPLSLTQEELAINIGLSRTSVVNMLAGKQSISIRHLYDMAEYLGIEAKDLLPGIKWYKENKHKKLKKIITFEVIDDEDI